MCAILSSLARGRGNRECVLIRNANMTARGRESMKCVLEKIGKKESAEKRQRKNG